MHTVHNNLPSTLPYPALVLHEMVSERVEVSTFNIFESEYRVLGFGSLRYVRVESRY